MSDNCNRNIWDAIGDMDESNEDDRPTGNDNDTDDPDKDDATNKAAGDINGNEDEKNRTLMIPSLNSLRDKLGFRSKEIDRKQTMMKPATVLSQDTDAAAVTPVSRHKSPRSPENIFDKAFGFMKAVKPVLQDSGKCSPSPSPSPSTESNRSLISSPAVNGDSPASTTMETVQPLDLSKASRTIKVPKQFKKASATSSGNEEMESGSGDCPLDLSFKKRPGDAIVDGPPVKKMGVEVLEMPSTSAGPATSKVKTECLAKPSPHRTSIFPKPAHTNSDSLRRQSGVHGSSAPPPVVTALPFRTNPRWNAALSGNANHEPAIKAVKVSPVRPHIKGKPVYDISPVAQKGSATTTTTTTNRSSSETGETSEDVSMQVSKSLNVVPPRPSASTTCNRQTTSTGAVRVAMHNLPVQCVQPTHSRIGQAKALAQAAGETSASKVKPEFPMASAHHKVVIKDGRVAQHSIQNCQDKTVVKKIPTGKVGQVKKVSPSRAVETKTAPTLLNVPVFKPLERKPAKSPKTAGLSSPMKSMAPVSMTFATATATITTTNTVTSAASSVAETVVAYSSPVMSSSTVSTLKNDRMQRLTLSELTQKLAVQLQTVVPTESSDPASHVTSSTPASSSTSCPPVESPANVSQNAPVIPKPASPLPNSAKNVPPLVSDVAMPDLLKVFDKSKDLQTKPLKPPHIPVIGQGPIMAARKSTAKPTRLPFMCARKSTAMPQKSAKRAAKLQRLAKSDLESPPRLMVISPERTLTPTPAQLPSPPMPLLSPSTPTSKTSSRLTAEPSLNPIDEVCDKVPIREDPVHSTDSAGSTPSYDNSDSDVGVKPAARSGLYTTLLKQKGPVSIPSNDDFSQDESCTSTDDSSSLPTFTDNKRSISKFTLSILGSGKGSNNSSLDELRISKLKSPCKKELLKPGSPRRRPVAMHRKKPDLHVPDISAYSDIPVSKLAAFMPTRSADLSPISWSVVTTSSSIRDAIVTLTQAKTTFSTSDISSTRYYQTAILKQSAPGDRTASPSTLTPLSITIPPNQSGHSEVSCPVVRKPTTRSRSHLPIVAKDWKESTCKYKKNILLMPKKLIYVPRRTPKGFKSVFLPVPAQLKKKTSSINKMITKVSREAFRKAKREARKSMSYNDSGVVHKKKRKRKKKLIVDVESAKAAAALDEEAARKAYSIVPSPDGSSTKITIIHSPVSAGIISPISAGISPDLRKKKMEDPSTSGVELKADSHKPKKSKQKDGNKKFKSIPPTTHIAELSQSDAHVVPKITIKTSPRATSPRGGDFDCSTLGSPRQASPRQGSPRSVRTPSVTTEACTTLIHDISPESSSPCPKVKITFKTVPMTGPELQKNHPPTPKVTIRTGPLRKDPETLLKEIELTRKDVEVTRKDVEVTRKDVEVIRKDTEGVRKDTEVSRKETEVLRKDAEASRKVTEVSRKDAEVSRKDAQVSRKDTEVSRKDLEVSRKDMEVSRKPMEVTRKDAEVTRKDVKKSPQKISDLTRRDIETKTRRDIETKLKSITRRDIELGLLGAAFPDSNKGNEEKSTKGTEEEKAIIVSSEEESSQQDALGTSESISTNAATRQEDIAEVSSTEVIVKSVSKKTKAKQLSSDVGNASEDLSEKRQNRRSRSPVKRQNSIGSLFNKPAKLERKASQSSIKSLDKKSVSPSGSRSGSVKSVKGKSKSGKKAERSRSSSCASRSQSPLTTESKLKKKKSVSKSPSKSKTRKGSPEKSSRSSSKQSRSSSKQSRSSSKRSRSSSKQSRSSSKRSRSSSKQSRTSSKQSRSRSLDSRRHRSCSMSSTKSDQTVMSEDFDTPKGKKETAKERREREEQKKKKRRSLLDELANSDGYIADKRREQRSDTLWADPNKLTREERALQRAMLQFTKMELGIEVQGKPKSGPASQLSPISTISSVSSTASPEALTSPKSTTSSKTSETPKSSSVQTPSSGVRSLASMKAKSLKDKALKRSRVTRLSESSDGSAAGPSGENRTTKTEGRERRRRHATSLSYKDVDEDEEFEDNVEYTDECESTPTTNSAKKRSKSVHMKLVQKAANMARDVMKKKWKKSSRERRKLEEKRKVLAAQDNPWAADYEDMVYDLPHADQVLEVAECASQAGSNSSSLDHVPPEVKKISVVRETGENLLHKAARLGYKEATLWCCENKYVNLNGKDHAGYAPLHEASTTGNVTIAKYLIAYGAEVNVGSLDGVRPLHDAVENNHLEMVRLLLSCGADIHLATYSGKKVLDLARTPEMKALIEGYLADMNGTADNEANIKAWELPQISQPPDDTDDEEKDEDAEVEEPDPMESCGNDIFADIPSDDDLDCVDVEFQFSSRPHLSSYYIRASRDDIPRNYVLLRDVVERLGVTRQDLVCAHPGLYVINLSINAFLCAVNSSQLCYRSKHLTLEPRHNSIELVELDATLHDILDVDIVTIRDHRRHRRKRKTRRKRVSSFPSERGDGNTTELDESMELDTTTELDLSGETIEGVSYEERLATGPGDLVPNYVKDHEMVSDDPKPYDHTESPSLLDDLVIHEPTPSVQSTVDTVSAPTCEENVNEKAMEIETPVTADVPSENVDCGTVEDLNDNSNDFMNQDDNATDEVNIYMDEGSQKDGDIDVEIISDTESPVPKTKPAETANIPTVNEPEIVEIPDSPPRPVDKRPTHKPKPDSPKGQFMSSPDKRDKQKREKLRRAEGPKTIQLRPSRLDHLDRQRLTEDKRAPDNRFQQMLDRPFEIRDEERPAFTFPALHTLPGTSMYSTPDLSRMLYSSSTTYTPSPPIHTVPALHPTTIYPTLPLHQQLHPPLPNLHYPRANAADISVPMPLAPPSATPVMSFLSRPFISDSQPTYIPHVPHDVTSYLLPPPTSMFPTPPLLQPSASVPTTGQDKSPVQLQILDIASLAQHSSTHPGMHRHLGH